MYFAPWTLKPGYGPEYTPAAVFLSDFTSFRIPRLHCKGPAKQKKKLIQSIIFACTDHRRKQNSSMTSMGSKVLQHQFLMHNRSPTFYEVSGPATCDSNFTASCYISGQTAHIYRRHAPGLSRVQLRNTTHLKTSYRVQPVLARISATAVVPMQHLRYFELFQISNQWKPDPINFDKEQKVCKLAVEFSLKAALIREQNIPRSSSGFFQ